MGKMAMRRDAGRHQSLLLQVARDAASQSLLLEHLESLATIDDGILQKRVLKEVIRSYVSLERRVDALLKNTLPASVAEAIKFEGRFVPRRYRCSILFTDFVGFTHICEAVSSDTTVEMLGTVFTAFDDIVSRHHGTKIKTIGDAYMAVFGAPESRPDHAVCAIRAARDMLSFMAGFNRNAAHPFHMRAGIHSGEVTAGVVGRERMQFDVFGDNVNIAARFEAAGAPDRINVSEDTHLAAQSDFVFEARGEIALKNKGRMRAYFVAEEHRPDSGTS
ncbi:MAG: adenylate/guanylate cyclase domain-containing protein [Pseudomonadota bacterium]